jgi:hypothetical protein
MVTRQGFVREWFSMATKRVRKSFTLEEQGTLGGLCGVYACINALKVLFRHRPLSQDDTDAAFVRLCGVLSERGSLADVIANGAMWRDELALTRELVAICKDHGLSVKRSLLGRGGGEMTLSQYWKALADGVNEDAGNGVAIIGISGAYPHWTTVFRVTPRHLILADSGWFADSQGLPRARCTVGEPSGARVHRVWTNETVLFTPAQG